MSAIEVKNLSKRFGKVQALKNVSLNLEGDKIFGFLGRNGAGKTTLLNIITNRIFSDEGEVRVDGENSVENDAAQEKIFYMTEAALYPDEYRVKEVFRITGDFYPDFDRDYAGMLAEKFEFPMGQQLKGLSTGYKSILKLILTLATRAPISLFDEPILGLDAHHRELFYRELLADYNRHPRSMVISTHLISEVADLLEEVIIIHAGEIILHQAIDDVLRMAYTVSGAASAVDEYAVGRKVIRQEAMGKVKASTILLADNHLDREAIQRLGLEITPPRLQELFVSLTGS